jgi:hypothetical protein
VVLDHFLIPELCESNSLKKRARCAFQEKKTNYAGQPAGQLQGKRTLDGLNDWESDKANYPLCFWSLTN